MTGARATPAARLDDLTRLYERHAYIVWNVALRTTLDDDAARSVARRAFVAQVAYPDESRLALDAAHLAVDAASGVDARDVEHAVLAATAHLAAVQRAVLALSELTDVPPRAVAEKLGIDPELERQLHDGAYEQLRVLLGVTDAEVRTAYEELPWVEPPAELWNALYPELHETVTQEAQPATAPVPVAKARTGATPRRARGTRRLRSAALAALAALAVAGVAWAATGGGDDGSGAGTQDYAGLPATEDDASSAEDEAGESASSLLTPEELDRLRREEIEQLKRLERRKDDRRLPQPERDRAARKVSDLVKLARQRQRAAEQRELAVRQQLAREREARIRERNRREQQRDEDSMTTSEQQPNQEQGGGQKEPTGGQKGGGDDGGDRDPVETECLYDPDNGTYICPE